MTKFEIFQSLKDRLQEYGMPPEALAIVEEMLMQEAVAPMIEAPKPS